MAGTCTACGTNAATCTSATLATACKDGYNLSAVVAGAADCNTACTDTTNCKTCGTQATPGTCTVCKVSTGWSILTNVCTKCTVTNCNTCSAAATCTACLTGFVLNANVCYSCDANCTDSTKCGTTAVGTITKDGSCPRVSASSNCKDGMGIQGALGDIAN